MTDHTSRVLVTGGTGFIGGWAIVRLLTDGYTVRTTVRDESRSGAVLDAVRQQVDPAGRLEFAVADLNSDDGWAEAMEGVDHVLHVAAPIGSSLPKDGDEAVATARGGTLRVLTAAADAGARRVVMTSAANAASPSSYADDSVSDESVWTDPDDPSIIAYRRAKTVSELAAWQFVTDRDDAPELVTVLPGAVLGPVLGRHAIGSVGLILNMLQGAMPGQPRIGLEVVDVRDLVDAHVRAMTADVAGERFLATGEFIWMREIAEILREELGDRASKVVTTELPDAAVQEAARTNPGLQGLLPALGRRNTHSTAKAQKVLGWQPRPVRDSMVDAVKSLIEHGLVEDPTR